MSEEKVLTLRGKRAVWAPGGGSGPIDPKRLPEGYPYKEQRETVVLAEQTVAFSDQGGQLLGGLNEALFVSGNTYKIIWDGTAYVCTATEIQGTIAIGNLSNVGGTGNNEPFMMMVTGGTTTIVALEGGAEHTVSISEYSETFHPMAPEFLPAGVGGGGVLRVNVTAVDGDVTNLTADKTYAEIVSAFEAGSVITAYFVLGTGYVFTLSQRGENHFLFHSIFTMSGSPVPMFLQIRNDDDVMLIESAFS